jgi:hypothetical protein
MQRSPGILAGATVASDTVGRVADWRDFSLHMVSGRLTGGLSRSVLSDRAAVPRCVARTRFELVGGSLRDRGDFAQFRRAALETNRSGASAQ